MANINEDFKRFYTACGPATNTQRAEELTTQRENVANATSAVNRFCKLRNGSTVIAIATTAGSVALGLLSGGDALPLLGGAIACGALALFAVLAALKCHCSSRGAEQDKKVANGKLSVLKAANNVRRDPRVQEVLRNRPIVAERPVDARSITFATWNIGEERGRKDSVGIASDPETDIISFQELGDNQAEQLNRFGYSVIRDDNNDTAVAFKTARFSLARKVSMIDAESKRIGIAKDSVSVDLEDKLTRKTLNVTSAHVTGFVFELDDGFMGNGPDGDAEYGSSDGNRQLTHISKYLNRSKAPIVLLGIDANATPVEGNLSSGYGRVKIPEQIAGLKRDKSHDDQTTVRGKHGGSFDQNCIDHAYIKGEGFIPLPLGEEPVAPRDHKKVSYIIPV